jgi:starch phosphorylase
MLRPFRTFTVVPSLPPVLSPLRDLAYNLHWCWHLEVIDLFRRLDRDLWEETGHNPLLMLSELSQQRLAEAAADTGFVAQMKRVFQAFNRYMGGHDTWYHAIDNVGSGLGVAYFSMEFGLTESLKLYSGGLGILAGDHLKSASDLGVPLVGMGLLYQQGYFAQYLNADGWQQEMYPVNDFHNLPLRLERDSQGEPLKVEVAFPGRSVFAQVWRAQVGRVPLFLLDTNLAENKQEDRHITDQLYGGDNEMRIQQEIILGIGGVRALRALDVRPTVYHMNEGHSAFLALERTRLIMAEQHLSFAEARELVAAGNLFTTHTPVPAGIDLFPPYLMDRYFGAYLGELGLSRDAFLGLGRRPANQPDDAFSMAILALGLSYSTNAVSQRHGTVAREMWRDLWPGTLAEDVPIGHVTNGIHLHSWLSNDMASLYERYLGPQWAERPFDRQLWARMDRIPDEELWRTHERRRERLVAVARRRLEQQMARRGATQQEIDAASEVLDPEALTIGFARRFATYKRALLLFSDPDRLSTILNDPKRPVQILFAGKAHPNDNAGKEFIRQIIHLTRRPDLRRRIIFLEDYDISLARYMVQGVDIWLNTPRQGMEASGTSGMKAVANGALHVSSLDGWWCEGYNREVGWRIGSGEPGADERYADEIDAQALYDLLEKEIVPLFYDAHNERLPRGWIAKMKRAVAQIAPVFNTHRMVTEYAERFYLRAHARYLELLADDCAGARDVASWKDRVRGQWDKVRIDMIDSDAQDGMPVTADINLTAHVHLGDLTPSDVLLLAYHGNIGPQGDITKPEVTSMTPDDGAGGGAYVYRATFACRSTGQRGYTVRLMPRYRWEGSGGYGSADPTEVSVEQRLAHPWIPGLVLWAS